MGDPRRRRKKYHPPGHPYQKPRLESELVLVGRFGLRNKQELWKARTRLGNYRAQARSVLALEEEERAEREKTLVDKLVKLGIVQEGATPDDILGLDVEALLNRRLQTMVLEYGLAGTIHQARQLIVHRHIAIDERVVTSPSYIVRVDEEDLIKYAPNSPLNDPEHPIIQGMVENPSLVEIPKSSKGGRR